MGGTKRITSRVCQGRVQDVGGTNDARAPHSNGTRRNMILQRAPSSPRPQPVPFHFRFRWAFRRKDGEAVDSRGDLGQSGAVGDQCRRSRRGERGRANGDEMSKSVVSSGWQFDSRANLCLDSRRKQVRGHSILVGHQGYRPPQPGWGHH